MLEQKLLLKRSKKDVCVGTKENSGRAVCLDAFSGGWRLCVGTFVRLRFSLWQFSMLMATEVHWFGFGSLWGLC